MTATNQMFLNTIDDLREFRQRMIDIEGDLSLLTEGDRQSAKDLLQLCTRISAEFYFVDTLKQEPIQSVQWFDRAEKPVAKELA